MNLNSVKFDMLALLASVKHNKSLIEHSVCCSFGSCSVSEREVFGFYFLVSMKLTRQLGTAKEKNVKICGHCNCFCDSSPFIYFHSVYFDG